MATKRGRKRKNDLYFGPEEEEAITKYLESTDDVEKNIIYNEKLKYPLEKMIELIIKKYKLYRKGFTLKEQCVDTISFLITKAAKFEKGRGKKAYSYYGTICKNYNLGLLIKDEKHMKQTSPYEDMSESIEQREELSYVIDSDNFSMDDFIKKIAGGIREEMNDEKHPPKKKLTENERKVGEALIEIFENWETAFNTMSGGSKYNKNQILETMRNYTNLSTKDIRLAMKRYKDLYELLKHNGL